MKSHFACSMGHGSSFIITRLFVSLDDNFLIVFDGQKPQHLLWRYATDKLAMKEISYHPSMGLLGVLYRKKKAPWPALPLQVALYEIKNMKDANTEDKEIEKFSFGHLEFNSYDPRNVCEQHCERIHFQWPINTFYRPKEEEIKNCYNPSKSYEPVKFE